MFEINGKEYELKYDIDRVAMIENVCGSPMMADLIRYRGTLGISSLMNYTAYGLQEKGSGRYVNAKTGQDMAKALIQNVGYTAVTGAVLQALERDCPYMFETETEGVADDA